MAMKTRAAKNYKVRATIVLAGLTFCVGANVQVGALELVNLPDPTRPPSIHTSALRRMSLDEPQKFAVTAIMISGESRRALVNGRLVWVGDRVGEARVVDIDGSAVTLEYLSEELRVPLLARQVRRIASEQTLKGQ